MEKSLFKDDRLIRLQINGFFLFNVVVVLKLSERVREDVQIELMADLFKNNVTFQERWTLDLEPLKD